MNSIFKPAVLAVALATVAVGALTPFAAGRTASKKAGVPYKSVQAIFDKKCIMCHHGATPPAKLSLENFAALSKGNDHGPVVTAGHPEKSLLYQVLIKTGKGQMPPRAPLTKPEIATISSWIKSGAKEK